MKGLVLRNYHDLSYEEVPEPTIGPEDVLIAVKACGICGSDVHGMDGSTGRRRPPIIMGHEAAGQILRVGERVHGWAAGDRVTFDSTIYCGACEFCRRGEVNCDAILHDAAEADPPPAGVVYAPNGDGVKLPSLGVHEHWNNLVDKQYSRNLGAGKGIELGPIFLGAAAAKP